MSPHKPDPLPRKVDVDLSGILIRTEQFNRSVLRSDLETENIFPRAWKESSSLIRLPTISSSEWASIIFAVGACLIGVFCTLWTFDDLDQFRRLAHPTADAMYVRPHLRANKSLGLISKKRHLPNAPQSKEPTINTLQEANDFSQNTRPPLSMLAPFIGNGDSPLLSSGGSAAASGSGPVQSTGPGRSSMSESGGGPNPQGRHAGHKIVSKQSPTANPTLHSPKSIVGMTKSLGARQTFQNRAGEANIQKTRTTQPTLNRAPMSMHMMKSGAGILQNQMGLHAMRMQHGMSAQPPAIAGLNVGLNGAGVGGGGGSGRHGGNARR